MILPSEINLNVIFTVSAPEQVPIDDLSGIASGSIEDLSKNSSSNGGVVPTSSVSNKTVELIRNQNSEDNARTDISTLKTATQIGRAHV